MKKIEIMIIAVAAMVFSGAHDVMARGGGGGHMGGGGGRGGGGWHGGGGNHGGGGGHRHPNNNPNNNYYYGGGGWGYGVADEAVVGIDVDTDPQPTTVIVEQPTTEVAQQPAPVSAPVGAQVTMLPPGAEGRTVGGTQFYISGGTWYKPYFGASGVYYEVVSPQNS